MKDFESIHFDVDRCRQETQELRDWLASKTDLKERKEVLPFFKARKHLSAFLGSYHPQIARYDLLAHEFPLSGAFTCDLVVGDPKSKAYVFVEFEDALPKSIFVKKRAKSTPEWSPRFEHGFSQIVDWFYELHDQCNTTVFEEKFGTRTIIHMGLLVIGRTEALGTREEQRLRWRQEFVLLNSKKIECKTFDQLCEDLLDRLERYPIAAEAKKGEDAFTFREDSSDTKDKL